MIIIENNVVVVDGLDSLGRPMPGVRIERRFSGCVIDRKIQRRILRSAPKYITRFVSEDFFEVTCRGSFYAKPLNLHRAREDEIASKRQSDLMEGLSSDFISNDSGFYKEFVHGNFVVRDLNVKSSGGHVHLVDNINDYCWCASLGKYQRGAARDFISEGNADLTHWVTYEVKSLVRSLRLLFSDCDVLASKVCYSGRDFHHIIGGESNFLLGESPFKKYMRSVFRKDPIFSKENEFRIIIAKTGGFGLLPLKSPPLNVEDDGIRRSIFSYGEV